MFRIITSYHYLKAFIYYKILFFKLEYASNEKIEKYQFRQLQKVIDSAWKNVPFYKKYWKENGFNPSTFKSLEDYDNIPFIDKDIIRNNLKDLVSAKAKKRELSTVKTGGTTGMPMKFYIHNPKAKGKEMAFLLNEFKRIGYRFYNKIIIIRGDKIDDTTIRKGKFWKYERFKKALVCSSFHLNEETLDSYIGEINKFKPLYMMAYPSSLTSLCRLMKNANKPKFSGLKAVICSSENVYDWQRKLVFEVLGVKIFSHYGHSEKAVFAGECEESNQMHFSPFYGYTQFVNKDNITCSFDGEEGEVVVTGFNQNEFPFIKYRTNDRVVYAINKCSCKRNYLFAKKIIGREQEFVIDKNGIYKTFIFNDEVFRSYIDCISAYQYIQNEKGILLIKIETKNGVLSLKDVENIKIECSKFFIDFTFEIEIVDKIKRTNSGKFKYLIQNIKL